MITATTTKDVASPAKGEIFKCVECGMEIQVIRDCRCQHGYPQFVCCGQPLTAAGMTFAAETKEAFIDQMQQGMDKTKQTLAWLNEKASEAKDSTKEELARDREVLSKQYEKVRESLGQVKDASSDAWKDMAKGCSESWQSFQAACSKAIARYR